MKKRIPLLVIGVWAMVLVVAALSGLAQATVNCSGVTAWVAGGNYTVGELVTYQGSEYKCAQANNNAAPNWDPIDWPGGWTLVGTCTSGPTATATATRTATATATKTATATATATATKTATSTATKTATATTTATKTATATATGTATRTATATATATRTATATATATGTSPACYAAWSSTTAYNNGATVSYNSVNYTAAYWNQGSNPSTNSGPAGSGEPWIPVGSCGGGSPSPTPTPTLSPTPKPTASATPTQTPGTSPTPQIANPHLSGSFLQPDLGDEWTDAQWVSETGYMKNASVTQMVLQWTADTKAMTTEYPTSLSGFTQSTKTDVVQRALSNMAAIGGSVYLGLQINDDWFVNYANNASWLDTEATRAQNLAQELYSKYGSSPGFAGWYLGFEVDNWNETTQTQWDALVSFYNTVGGYLRTLDSTKKIMISPFFNTSGGLTSSQYQSMWQYILGASAIDIIAVQDGIGAGHATVAQLPAWFQAFQSAIAAASPKTSLWTDSETYNADFQPMAIAALVSDMTAVRPYVSNYLSFSFNHYMSPQQVNPLYYTTYMNYLSSGVVENVPPSVPTGLTASAANSSTVNLAWTASTDNVGVAGYQVFRNAELVTTIYSNTTSFSDVQLAASTAYTYQVLAFDAAGNQSGLSATAAATTPAGTVYATNLAAGKNYTASLPADPSYPDTGGVELTNGIYGSPVYTDPAWQGRNTGSSYSFTIDLGSVQTIKEIVSDWLQYQSVYIFLPQTVTYSVSSDGVNFTAAGTVNKPAPGSANLSQKYILTGLTGVSGRYVLITVQPPSAAWTFIDEAEVRH